MNEADSKAKRGSGGDWGGVRHHIGAIKLLRNEPRASFFCDFGILYHIGSF